MMHPEWSYDAVLYEMNIRQLTPEGTLRAAAARLPFLRDMGVDALWLMPVHPIGVAGRKGSLGSYYSVRDYCAINPEFGTMADFDAFVAEAHRLGMKVLLDWVANHTSRDAEWIAEGRLDLYELDDSGQPKIPFDWSDTAKLDYSNNEVRQRQIESMRFWIERHAVDGFRCDMAMLVPPQFWREVRAALQAVKPDIFMLAEAEEPVHFEDGAFDACYAWELHHAMCDVAAGRSRVWELRNRLYAGLQKFPPQAVRLMFTSNHDENSWSGSEFVRLGAAVRVMAALTFLLPQSMPLIYTGQELGCDHSFAFFDRDPVTASASAPEFTAFYRSLCALKHSAAALRAGEGGGSFVEIANNAPDCMMTFVRECAGSRVVALMNLSPYRIFSDYRTGIYSGSYRDALTGEPFFLHEHTWGDVEPWDFRILVSE